jgi:hypothetical protein
MAKKEGMLDEVGDAPAEGPVGATQQPAPDPPVEAADGNEQQDATDERPNPAKAADRPEGYVPEQSLREAREELKAIKRQLRERDKQYGSLEERTNLILKNYFTEDGQPARGGNGQAAKKQAEAAPNPDQDIFGAVKHSLRELEQLKGNYGQIQQQSQQQQVVSTLRSAYVQDAQKVRAEKPDFDDAYSHLIRNRDLELQRLGVADSTQRQAMIEMEELQIVANAVQRDESPAEIAYELAKMRGYVPKQGQQAAPDLARIAAGQERNKSLSLGAGAPAAGSLDARALARMSEDQIHELMKTRAGRQAVDRAMGLQQ